MKKNTVGAPDSLYVNPIRGTAGEFRNSSVSNKVFYSIESINALLNKNAQ